jgi:hypothetical protein
LKQKYFVMKNNDEYLIINNEEIDEKYEVSRKSTITDFESQYISENLNLLQKLVKTPSFDTRIYYFIHLSYIIFVGYFYF